MRSLVIALFFPFTLFAQNKLQGVWQGVLIPQGKKMEQASIFWLKVDADGTKMVGLSRTDVVNTAFYALKKVKGSISGTSLKAEEYVLYKEESPAKMNWCRLVLTLSYNDSTGYLSGDYTSNDCRMFSGKIILFSSYEAFSEGASPTVNDNWFEKFVSDYNKGKKAPKLRENEAQNFDFHPLYFDFDKWDIRPEYVDYLKKMIDILNDHSDLRIKVIGNTDSDGSDEYNVGLSERRAQAIVQFYEENGLSKDKIILDFKGESNPVSNNATKEGRQQNRRVDFEFTTQTNR